MNKSQQLSEKQKEQLQRCEFLAASIPPETLSAENRTVDCVWFTGADVARYDFWNDEIYIRRFDAKGADLSFLNCGAPVLDSHSMGDGSSSQKGKVEKAWIDQKNYKATLRFSRRPEVDGLWQDIQDNIVTKFSMGTEILEEKKFTEDDGKGNQVKVRLATSWRPFEISVLPLPADFGTTTLAADLVSATLTRATAQQGEEQLEKEKIPGSDAPKQDTAVAQLAPASTEAARAAGVVEERLRVSEIRKISHAVKLEESFIVQHVDGGTAIEVFRKAALEHLAARDAALPAIRSANASITRDEVDTRREAMTGMFLNRFDAGKYKLEEPSREYAGLSLIECAKECLQATGVNVRGLSRMKVAELAFQSGSDFPLILAATANKTLRAGYELVPSLWRQIAAPRSAPDFKTMRDLQFDSTARLEKVNPSGEFHRGALVESQETWQLATYGKVISINRQSIINDDLGAFTRVPMLMGQEVALLEGDLVWGVITANAALSDTVALFHANHANLVGSGTAISVDNLGIMRKLIRLQTSIGGKTLNLMPKYVVVPVAKEQLAMQYTSPNFQPTAQSGINPWTGSLTPIAEARLDANSTTAWYMFCDPGIAPVVIYAYLQGQEGPFTETRLGFEVDGTEFKVRQDFGVGAIDFRGAAKNPGA